ncbi:spindle pole body formation-associated protein-domain-containing protein [Xylariomycetidae sp. FL0641]|nr:spindle pole body formation-associated protein-domain-containing protein [Xylariomycetidae sp. FL0641]
MLGWALKKSFQGATGRTDAPEAEDTTQIDAPDTPAPVFAARAIKNALWGVSTEQEQDVPIQTNRTRPAAPTVPNAKLQDAKSPTKPNSILLTPGTATSRRKRVSFGRDVKAANNVDCSPLAASSTGGGRQRRKTTLQQALENSRSSKANAPQPVTETQPTNEALDDESEGEWEDDVCNHDVTLDLNEPHSESGKYWKSEFNRYRDEAKSNMETLVKFKALAKSYAAQKDAEASGLSQKLQEEQAKVAKMEAKIKQMASQVAVKRKHGADEDSTALMKELAEQTALASQYCDQVKELHTLLKQSRKGSGAGRRGPPGIDTSPRTENTLLEVQRELRRAKSDLRDMNRLRDEVKELKSELTLSRQRVKKLEGGTSESAIPESSRVHKLEKQLREVKDESRHKDSELRRLKREYESLKRNAKARTAEALEVLQEKNDKIAELEKNIKTLKASGTSSSRPHSLDSAIAEHNRITRDFKSGMDSLSKASKYENAGPRRRPKRSASVEDMTLDMTQRSLLGDKYEPTLDRLPKESRAKPVASDWTDDLIDIGEQLGKDKRKYMESNKREKELLMEDSDAIPTAEGRTRKASRRIMSDVPASRVNVSTRRAPGTRDRAFADDPYTDEYHRGQDSRSGAGQRVTSLATDKATLAGEGEKPKTREELWTSANPSSLRDVSGIDLMQNRYVRLGAADTERKDAGSASRCTLPADRLAAARARLEQKKRQRQQTNRGLDKENLGP